MIRRRLSLALLLGAMAAGCTTPTVGTPQPDSASLTASRLPARPRPLPLDDVDLCTLLTAQDRADLGLFPGSPGGSSELDPATSLRLCGWDHLDGTADDASTHEQACTKARTVMALIVTNLGTQQGS